MIGDGDRPAVSGNRDAVASVQTAALNDVPVEVVQAPTGRSGRHDAIAAVGHGQEEDTLGGTGDLGREFPLRLFRQLVRVEMIPGGSANDDLGAVGRHGDVLGVTEVPLCHGWVNVTAKLGPAVDVVVVAIDAIVLIDPGVSVGTTAVLATVAEKDPPTIGGER